LEANHRREEKKLRESLSPKNKEAFHRRKNKEGKAPFPKNPFSHTKKRPATDEKTKRAKPGFPSGPRRKATGAPAMRAGFSRARGKPPKLPASPPVSAYAPLRRSLLRSRHPDGPAFLFYFFSAC